MRNRLSLIVSVFFGVLVLTGVGYIYAKTWNRPGPEAYAEIKLTERHAPEAAHSPTQIAAAEKLAAVGGPFQPVTPGAGASIGVSEKPGDLTPSPRGGAGAILNKFDAAALQEGVALVVAKKFPEALARLKPIEEIASGNQEFDVAYGIALLETGNPKDAVTAFRRALSNDPNHMLARVQLARALSSSGQLDAAKREVEVIRAREDLTPDVRTAMDRNSQNLGEAIERRDTSRRMRVAQAGTGGSGGIGGADGAALKRAAELVRAKRPDEALKVLAPLQARHSGNPDFDYVYGVALLDSGRPAEAVIYLRRASQNRPDFHVARAELGRALAAMGDLEGARREFTQVRDVPNLPVHVRDAMGREVVGIDRALQVVAQKKNQPQTTVSGYVEQSLGYDTNVNGGPAGLFIIIPGISATVPAQLDPAGAKKEAPFYEIAAGINIAHAISNDTALFANYVGNFHRLFYNTEYSTALVGAEVGIARQVADGSILSLALIGQAFWLDDSMYRGIYGVAGQWRKKIGDWDANVALTWLGMEYQDTTNAGSADRYMISGGIGRKFGNTAGQPSFLLTVSGGTEIARDKAYEFAGYDFMGARYTGEIILAPTVTGFGQLAYEYHRHHADYPFFDTPRKEHLFEVMLGLEWRATERISYRPMVRYSRTASNVDLFDTERWIWSVAGRYTF